MGGVAAVIFDWGGTLTPWHTVDIRAQWRQTYAAHVHGDDEVLAERLTDALCAADAHHWQLARDEHRSSTIEQVLEHACTALGLEVASIDGPAVRAAYERWWEPHTYTDPHVRPLWSWLREQGIGVGVLSNTIWSRDYHRGLFARDGVLDLVDGDVYTSELDVVKPHPDAFRAAAEAVGADPADCVYVGDRLYEDVHGPQQVGMRTVHVPHSDIPADQTRAVEVTPHAVAHHLADVAGIVHGWRTAGHHR
jgi:putative hydrolase of the HAD superfamily